MASIDLSHVLAKAIGFASTNKIIVPNSPIIVIYFLDIFIALKASIEFPTALYSATTLVIAG